MLSKNTASSRAIPFNKMIEVVESLPFIPIAWQKEHKGMQGTEYWTDERIQINDEEGGTLVTEYLDLNHLLARDYAISQAKIQNSLGATKQICNRYLEPFMWTTMLITGSKEGWDNFFSLRLPEYHLENVPTVNKDLILNSKTLTLVGKSKKELLKSINEIDNDSYTGFKTIINNYSDLDWLKLNKGQAEIHMMALAESIYDAMNESTPKQLKADEWHIPFLDKMDLGNPIFYTYNAENPDKFINTNLLVKVSTAMAARTSYTIVGDEKKLDYNKMIELHDRLISQEPLHASPMEHCARTMSDEEYATYFKGIKSVDEEDGTWYNELTKINFLNEGQGWCRNYKGFIQYRHILETNKY